MLISGNDQKQSSQIPDLLVLDPVVCLDLFIYLLNASAYVF